MPRIVSRPPFPQLVLGLALLGVVALVMGAGYVSPHPRTQDALLMNQMAVVIYSASADVTYFGYARPGTATTDAAWQLKKITATGSGGYPNQTVTTWANGSNEFRHQVGATAITCESMLAANYE
jgi:hypothetical protein